MKAMDAKRFGMSSFGAGPQVVGFLLVIGLLVAMAIQPTRQLLAQKERLNEMSRDLDATEGANARLKQRIERLRDPDYIEQRAREQIGLARPGETTYVVMPPSKASRRQVASPRKPAAPPPAEPPSGVRAFLMFLGVL